MRAVYAKIFPRRRHYNFFLLAIIVLLLFVINNMRNWQRNVGEGTPRNVHGKLVLYPSVWYAHKLQAEYVITAQEWGKGKENSAQINVLNMLKFAFVEQIRNTDIWYFQIAISKTGNAREWSTKELSF